MFNLGTNKAVQHKPGKYMCPKCLRDFNVLAKGNRCPYCEARLTKRAPGKAKATKFPNSVAVYYVVEVEKADNPPCG